MEKNLLESELTQKIKELSPAAGSFNRLYELAVTLRSKKGCPWDRDQTPQSMRRNLMEEVFEAIDAITCNDSVHVREELGDVLFNTIITAEMFEQHGDFKIEDTMNDVCDKLIRRHPHVFGEISDGKTENNGNAGTAGQIKELWERIKDNVEGRKEEHILNQVPESFPPLLKSYKLLSKASRKGFEWPDAAAVKAKCTEEYQEVLEAEAEVSKLGGKEHKPLTVSGGNDALNAAQLHLEEELGDLLLSTVNLCRFNGVDPCIALDRANRKFKARFEFVEDKMTEKNISMDKNHLCEMEKFWKDAKNNV